MTFAGFSQVGRPERLRKRRLRLVLQGSAVCCLVFFAPCKRTDLAVREVFGCDDFAEGRCLLLRSSEVRHEFSVPASRSGTWRDLGYHMYFHSRQTPGLRVLFDRRLARNEMEKLKKTLSCSYRLRHNDGRSASGELEGLRFDEYGFWCFDYLGTMLVKFHKKHKSIQKRPQLDFFPVELELSFSDKSGRIAGHRRFKVTASWIIEKSQKN